MVKTLRDKFEREAISSLPRALFEGAVEVVDSEEDAERAVERLLAEPLLGFDTETRPSFRKGIHNDVALLQVASPEHCYLFRLSKMGLPPCLVRFLSAESGVRVALSWTDDLHQLHRRADFECAPMVELQDYAAQLGIEDRSLQKLYANIVGGQISKRQRLSNWERPVLTTAQQLYAATDAWACVVLYREIKRLLDTGEYVLMKCDDGSEDVEA
ncbi:MAG: 3'-5' exonuclease domain-containing protein 2 [Prevotellaceae bacterium]|nr:3'-5' exonuclease domain-containing protein 2 [Prevotellaceae bacterium]MCD8303798.1 3'-5' exonuclease domain-containing protein 2 [Prevotellaceae bacterium]